VTVFNPFISPLVWKANGGEADAAAFEFGEVYAGLDLSVTTDLTAFVMVAKWQDAWHVRPVFWMAADLVPERARVDRRPYDVWAKQGTLLTTPGKSIDYGFVAAEIAALLKGKNVKQVAFDRYRMGILRAHLNLLGVELPLLDFGQGYASMSPAVQALETELLNERVKHGNHPVLTMCASNAVVIRDPAGNRKLDKAKSTGRIDGMVGLAMAIGAAMSNVAATPVLEPAVRYL
jgi:phage terminase large subunit-like protein